MAGIEQRLAEHRVIGLDTAVFIYHFEAHRDYLGLTTAVLNSIQAGQQQAVGSVILIMELTVLPWRNHQPNVARQYEALLANFPNLKLYDVTRETARKAAQLRADYNLCPADALHVATALVNGATAFVSNDRQLARLEPIIEPIILAEFV